MGRPARGQPRGDGRAGLLHRREYAHGAALPLSADEKKVSVFGKNSVELVYGGTGSGGGNYDGAATLSQSLSSDITLAKHLRIGIGAEHYRTQLTTSRYKNTVLFDASAAYTFGNGWELSLTARNLLDEKEYAYTLFDALSRSSASFAIRPRNVLLSLYVKF